MGKRASTLGIALAGFALAARAETVVLDNPYVRVSRNAAPCSAAAPGCAERVVVALGPVELPGPKPRRLGRGQVAVFGKGEVYAPPKGEFLEVAFKPNRPPVEAPAVRIAPEKNELLYDGDALFVFEEKLLPGETRPRHSHAQRVVVVINETKLQQWPDGAAELLRQQIPDDVRFNPPVVHVVKNVGALPLRNVVLELKPTAPAAGSRPEAGEPEKVIALLLFPELTLLDLVGPLQVLRGLPAPYRTVVVGEKKEPMVSDTGLALTPERSFAEVPRPFAILVPGGPGSVASMANPAIQGYLRSAAPQAEVVGSVCTGALVLGAAGLLEGRKASTHWAYAKELEKLGALYVRERYVEDGKYITGGGVSSGIDMALALVARLTDKATAQRIQLGIEYDPRPPFGAIDWSRVGDAELERQRQGGTGRRLKDAPQLLKDRPDLLRRLGLEDD